MAEPARQLDPYDEPGNEPHTGHQNTYERNSSEDLAQHRQAFNPQVVHGGLSTDGEPSNAADLKAAEQNAGSNTQGQNQKQEPADNSDSSLGQRVRKAFTSKTARRTSIISLLIGGGGTLTIAGFLQLLPLKINSMVDVLQREFSAASTNALGAEERNILNGYIAKYVLPGVKSGLCHSTIDATCVSGVRGQGPFKQLYTAYMQQHAEQSMAKKWGIVFGKNGNQLYMTINGELAADGQDMQDVIDAKTSIFNVGGNRLEKVSVADVRKALDSYFENATEWDRIWFRFKYGKLLEEKYGVKRCIIACNLRDRFTDSINTKKVAAKGYIIQRVISPMSESYGLIMQCVVSDASFCDTALQELQPGEEEKLSPFQSQLRQRLVQLAAEDPEQLAEIVQTASDISKNGLGETVVSKMLTAVFGEKIGQLGSKAVPVVGWVLFAAQIVHTAAKIGPTLRIMGYAANAAAAVQLWSAYSSVAAETKSGHVDGTELGSFNEALSTNLTGSKNDRADATTTPLYGLIFGTHVIGSKSPYTCEGGTKVTSGSTCPNEKLDRGNAVTNQLSSIVDSVPGLVGLADVINLVNDLIGDLTSGAFDIACNLTDPPCKSVVNAAGSKIAQLTTWFAEVLVPSPITKEMSGGRIFDMMAAGADVAANSACRILLGCTLLTKQQVADIRNQELTQEKTAFESRPMFARIFSTDTPYSLVSRLAIAMPSDMLTGVSNAFTSIASDPLGHLASSFSSIFASDKAFAAPTPFDDPFGVLQYGYPAPPTDDSENYWNQKCQGDYKTPWLSAQQESPNTGEPVATTTNRCMLIENALQGAGGAFDASLLPSNSLTPDPAQ